MTVSHANDRVATATSAEYMSVPCMFAVVVMAVIHTTFVPSHFPVAEET